MLHSQSKPRTEPSPSKVPSLSSKEFTSPREKELLITLRATPRKTQYVSPTTRTEVSALHPNALSSPYAHLMPPSVPTHRQQQSSDNERICLSNEGSLLIVESLNQFLALYKLFRKHFKTNHFSFLYLHISCLFLYSSYFFE